MGRRAWVRFWGGRPEPRSSAISRQLRERNPARRALLSWQASGAGEWLHERRVKATQPQTRAPASEPFVTPGSWESGVWYDCFWRGALRLIEPRIFCEKEVV